MKAVYFLLLITTGLFAQSPSIKSWDYRYGGTDIDHVWTLVKTLDGGFLSGGYSLSGIGLEKTDSARGGFDYWVVKTDSDGIKIWDKSYGGSGYDVMTTCIALSDSGFLLGGYSLSPISGDKSEDNRDPSHIALDYWVIRIDKNGNKLWDKTFGGTSDEELKALQQLPGGDFLLGGYTFSDSTGDMSHYDYGYGDYWVVKIDANGNKIWDKNYGGTEFDDMTSMVLTPDGNILLGGYSNSPAGPCKTQSNYNSSGDFWIVKIDTSGAKIWDKIYGGSAGDALYEMCLLPSGNICLAGVSGSPVSFDKTYPNHGGINDFDFWVVIIDSAGIKLWDKVYGGNSDEVFLNTATSVSNGILLCGTSKSNLSGDKSENNSLNPDQPWVLLIDSAGNKLWDKTLHNIAAANLNGGVETSGGCFVFASSVTGDGGYVSLQRWSEFDYWLVKFCYATTLPVAACLPNATAFCQNNCINFTNQSQNAISYQWIFPGGSPSTSTDINPQGICYFSSGVFDVTLIATNMNGSDSITLHNVLNVYPSVQFSPIFQVGDTLFATPGFVSYQWFSDTTILTGANQYYLIATHSGNYSVLISDSNGCTALASALGIIAADNSEEFRSTHFDVYFSSGKLFAKIKASHSESGLIEVIDVSGKICYSFSQLLKESENRIEQNINLVAGIYLVKITTSHFTLTKRIIVK